MIRFPFMTMQQLNLDWILQQLKTILKFMPINSGSTGDVLQRTNDGAAWRSPSAVAMDIHGLDAAVDIDSLDELPMYDVSSQGNFKITVGDLLDEAPVTSVNGQTGDVVLPIPSVPVDSVNGQTGTVVLDASDVGALPDTYTAPVSSVNGNTGAVTVPVINNIGATEFTTVTATPTGSAITVHNNKLRVEISADKKRIRVSGFLTFKSDDTSDWKFIYLTDDNNNPFDISIPANQVQLNNAAIFFDENKLPAYIGNAIILRFLTDGRVCLIVWQGTSTPNLDQTIYMFGHWYQLAL